MTNVFFTTDVEIWCGGWRDLDRKFPDAFRQYIYGPTPGGERGVAYQVKMLNEHNLKGTFFVEPLFALRFGLEPLTEIVGLIQAPATGLARAIGGAGRNLAVVVDQGVQEKKFSE